MCMLGGDTGLALNGSNNNLENGVDSKHLLCQMP